MRRSLRAGVIAGLVLVCISAQPQTGARATGGLSTAEALWKAHRYADANEAFRLLVAANPKNPEYKVRWGRLLLERFNPGDAAGLFNEALELKPNDAGALLGMALIAADNFDARAADLAHKALESDPKLLEAQELLARLALEDNDTPKATEEAKKALAIDANSVQGKAVLATIDWLADRKDSPWDPKDARGYATVGRLFVLNRRYEEGIGYYRKAIELDPTLDSARSELGINLMRIGESDEAYDQLATCYKNGFTDSATVNSLRLLDTLKTFVTFKTDHTILKMDKKEAALLHPYFEEEMQRAISTYEKKYKMTLTRPVQVEVYPNHEDFAVRTLGMPGLGALGVTFGYVIAMDSPSGRKPGNFHWASTMWHEMSHVFTLTATGHRVPRWFTEGMAVHEETAVSPEWGDRLSPVVIKAIKDKKLLPITELDRGFVHPTSPAQVLVSYFQAGRICDYINQKWGWDTLLAMLHDFGAGEDTGSVVRKELKIEPEAFDQQFIASVNTDTKNTVDHFDEWKQKLQQVSDLASKKDYDGVIKLGTEIRDYYPDYVEDGSVYEFLAKAYLEKGDKKAAADQLERYTKIGGRNPDTLKRLAGLLVEAGNKKEAAAVLDRLNYIYPIDGDLHRQLGDLWFDLGNTAGAVREFQAVLAYHPIDPAQAHFDLARAYNRNHQTKQAQDETLAALEIAPGFRPAQKLLLELSGSEAEQTGTPNPTRRN
ncbi:MAG TPA: tetratricopeptide repeat protein [Bryobacteraceae bacterium]|nr:tetratricopeptide repeat protein [Bryobacteraceae bacterium]